ncbi:hypothetical protein FVEN_g11134 [Fusarium venenatum]|uniref:Aminoglycoside phosphotransferase domain-containing protein n=1 Tax=Fusarium venenatum TaxID=56646 RepID=A0A2L2TL00_9HYPO|nr:uncharacterized protein FVRRES_08900 [Fusarium venenatum]KAG8350664.1 hypothetical protein FVEN_g11134 [Fusarium venenatum]KAH6965630.1 hypothetical protein EDB82DRAFT_513332 [Fusarium venenatum]CEI68823.1 unnamed protein product [Fusarium venenatum]
MVPKIPTIVEIRASTVVLSTPDASATVVRVGENLAVKLGRTVTLLEADNLRFLSTNSKVPVPEVYATMVEPETNSKFIVMEYIDAKILADLWPCLEAPDKLEIVGQIRAILQDLRSLKPPSYFGSLDRRPLEDGCFWTPGRNPAMSGPFDTEDDLNEGMLKKMAGTQHQKYLAFLRTVMSWQRYCAIIKSNSLTGICKLKIFL